MTDVRCPLDEAAYISKEQAAIVGAHGLLLYSEVEQCVRATQQLLERRGWQRGDRAALVLPAGWEQPVVLMALLRMGVVACPLDSRTPSAKLADRLVRMGATRLITTKARMKSLDLPGVDVAIKEELVGFIAKLEEHHNTHLSFGQLATILPARSGKGIAHTFESHYYSAKGSNTNIRLHQGARWLQTSPWHTAEGLAVVFRCFMAGTAVVIPKRRQSILEAVNEYDVTHLSLDAKQLDVFLGVDVEATTVPKVQAVMVMGAPSNLVQEAVKRGFHVYNSFGLPEMASVVTASVPESTPSQRVTLGKVLPYREIGLSDKGEVLVRGRTLFKGYVNGGEPELPTNGEGWFAIGKRGVLDDQGYLQLTK